MAYHVMQIPWVTSFIFNVAMITLWPEPMLTYHLHAFFLVAGESYYFPQKKEMSKQHSLSDQRVSPSRKNKLHLQVRLLYCLGSVVQGFKSRYRRRLLEGRIPECILAWPYQFFV